MNAPASPANPATTTVGQASTSEAEPTNKLHVVAIGASAGGLDALEKLFAALPPDTGAAFVVIQHLSPDHKSMMASLLARHTSMPVVMVEENMPIQANKVFLIPPGSIMHTDGQLLRLTPKSPRTLTLPIDVFFQSLATHHGDHAVGVVLSGTGSDGTRGAGAINEAGGFLIAQDPENAKFDGMPRSVIATGLVDAILPIEGIAQRVVAHITNQAAPLGEGMHEALQRNLAIGPDAALSGILHLLLQLGGINFDDYKPGTVMRRIERRMAVQQVGSIEGYLALLNQDRAEVLTLRRELLIPVTSFFRDTEAFEALMRQVIDPIVSSKEAGQTIRVWCAGVSTGEEAYSVAMLFLEAFEQAKRWPTLKIFATDVDQLNIETAAAGTYPESIMAEVSPHQLERFFTKKNNAFVVKNELRQCIVFARHNMLSDPPFTKMDLVVCRNALIYFRSSAQDRALRRMQYALGAKGYLFLGSSESLGDLQRDFQTLSARHKIWQVVRPTSLPLDMGRGVGGGMPLAGVSRRASSPAGQGRPVGSAIDQGFHTLLKAFAPPAAILVNGGHELVHSYGDVQPFLRIREGQASLDINRILPDALIPVSAALLFKSTRENTSAQSDVVRLALPTAPGQAETEAVRIHVRLSAWPVGEVDGQRLTLLAFETVNAPERVDAPVAVDIHSETSERIEVLEHELAATRESLQATIEELETSNEELQATNEEMMASNEELQSSNEELQSVNEELNTVNAEYQEKIDILNRLNADLDSLARVASSGTVFVDEQMHLTRFSPEAAQIFRLRESDIGRPLEDLNHTLDYPAFIHDLRTTLQTAQPIEEQVTDSQNRCFLVKMLPYRIPSSASRGVVVSFVDMTSVNELARMQAILDALAEHVAVLDTQGTITMVNRAWREFAAENGDPACATCGTGINYLLTCQRAVGKDCGYAERAAKGLRAVLDGLTDHFSMEYPCHGKEQERWFVMHISPLLYRDIKSHPHAPSGTPALRGVVISHVNITAWRNGGQTDDGDSSEEV
ncbi:MAG TPA: CheR family methyltransferase [Burkholderiaceae bacterium]|nr:CheR family methyltransferase [Burkholderiaceae bacterium]